ncbi:nucleoside recognition protein [Desulfospira joergensenii]|uniref:nucleoside recognition protein n=1 Tax=Desulfospira joergensenii TaxID=53329 RepID=UPI0003B48E75|nr:nucleoside recognition protein [Desulfospira joergensenii]
MKKKELSIKNLGISLGVTLCMIGFCLVFTDSVNMDTLVSRLGFPLFRLMVFICIGLLAGQIIEGMGWTRQAAVLARPFFRFSNLGHHCSAAFTTAFISGAAANAMLLEFYEQKKITKLQLFLSNYVNQFPAFFLHLPTTMFIVLPLTGFAGALYFFLTFGATAFRTACFFIFGHFFLPEPSLLSGPTDKGSQANEPSGTGYSALITRIKKSLPIRISNILTWVLPIYTLVFILNANGFFTYLNQAVTRYVSLKLIPVESLSVVVLSFAAEFTSGFAAAGALMDAGVLSIKQTVIALLLGNVLAFPIRALRHQIPRYMGIFSPKMGLQLLLSGQAFRVASIILAGTLYFFAA